jgi:hypothetical protein
MRKVTLSLFLAGLLIFVALFTAQLGGERGNVALAAITPVAGYSPASGTTGNVVPFMSEAVLTADTRACIDLRGFTVVDLQFVIDQGTTNTTTLKLQHSNNGVHFTDGQTIVASNTADANGLNRYDLFGRDTCVFADVTNSNPITITVLGLPRQ